MKIILEPETEFEEKQIETFEKEGRVISELTILYNSWGISVRKEDGTFLFLASSVTIKKGKDR